MVSLGADVSQAEDAALWWTTHPASGVAGPRLSEGPLPGRDGAFGGNEAEWGHCVKATTGLWSKEGRRPRGRGLSRGWAGSRAGSPGSRGPGWPAVGGDGGPRLQRGPGSSWHPGAATASGGAQIQWGPQRPLTPVCNPLPLSVSCIRVASMNRKGPLEIRSQKDHGCCLAHSFHQSAADKELGPVTAAWGEGSLEGGPPQPSLEMPDAPANTFP